MAAIDTSSIKWNTPTIKSRLKSMYIADAGRTPEELAAIVAMFEAKWERIQTILQDPNSELTTEQRASLTAKLQRILENYFLIKKWQDGVRP